MNHGIVVEYHRDVYTVLLSGQTQVVTAQLRSWHLERLKEQAREQSFAGELTFARQIAVGDQVQLSNGDGDNWYIDKISPRSSWLARSGKGRFSKRAQLLVANASQLAIVVAAQPRPKAAFIDRCLVAAVQGGLDPLLIINKIDLDPGVCDAPEFEPYRKLGLRIIYTSALSGSGLAALADEVSSQITVLAGLSGVGKSSLINELTGTNLLTDHIHQSSGQGRHTTVNARMIALDGGGWLVDTPGIKSFGLTHITRQQVDDCFSDLADLSGGCRFSDCSHSTEPGCSVREEIEAGRISADRIKSYNQLLKEVDANPEWKHAHS